MRTVAWANGKVRLIDQTRLPAETVWLDCGTVEEVAAAIREMRVRGAPAIGVAAGYGIALAAHTAPAEHRAVADDQVARAADMLAATRPTAVNLFWAIARMRRAASLPGSTADLRARLLSEAEAIADEDELACRTMGAFGAALIPAGASILTHCNAGALATAAYGTALGVIRAAHEAGKGIQVYVDETRPLLQGARLTAWELVQAGIPATLIADNMAGAMMRRGKIDCVVVGADRIAANGDVANKIGTYTVAVLAKEHGIPFYVAAPISTIDLAVPDGDAIPIEERRPEEVTHLHGVPLAPAGVRVENPAFDVTPQRYIAAIITEQGVLRPPFATALATAVRAAEAVRTPAAATTAPPGRGFGGVP